MKGRDLDARYMLALHNQAANTAARNAGLAGIRATIEQSVYQQRLRDYLREVALTWLAQHYGVDAHDLRLAQDEANREMAESAQRRAERERQQAERERHRVEQENEENRRSAEYWNERAERERRQAEQEGHP
jgi:hypothetical protein